MRSAIILAGGESNRFKKFGCSDKALLMIDGMTVLEKVVEVCLKVCDEVVIVGRSYPSIQRPEIRQIPDIPMEVAGPFRGIYTGVKEVRGDLCVVTSVDRPYLRPEVLEILLDEMSGMCAAVPMDFKGTVYPLISCIRRSAVLDGMRRVLNSGKKLRADEPLRMCDEVKFICLDFFREVDPHLKSFIDVDLPEDLHGRVVDTSPCDEQFKILSASKLYWEGISHMKDDPMKSFDAFLNEASLYEGRGVKMIQLHALVDAYNIGRTLGLQLDDLDAELRKIYWEIRGCRMRTS